MNILFGIDDLDPKLQIPADLIPRFTAQKMKFSIKHFFSKCVQIRRNFTFTEEILNGKLHFLCSD